MIIVIFLTWFKKLWVMFWAETSHSEPENKFILFLYDASKRVQSSITARVTIYLLIIVIHCSATFIQLVNICINGVLARLITSALRNYIIIAFNSFQLYKYFLKNRLYEYSSRNIFRNFGEFYRGVDV